MKNNSWINQTIHYLIAKDPFKGNFLQECDIIFNTTIPTAALFFSKKTLKYTIWVNPEYFREKTLLERIAIFQHEILHFLNGHLFRFNKQWDDEKEQKLANIACDIAINQYIENLPKGTVNVEDWNKNQTTKMEKYKNAEYYYEVLKQTTQQKKESDQANGDNCCNSDQLGKYVPFDDHNWDELSEEDKQVMLEKAKEMVQRTIEKTAFTHSLIPGFLEDFFKEIDGQLNKINYKYYLKWAIKKTLSANDRKTTWNRPNKRYYNYAPGHKNDVLPFLNIYIDTSGSISYTELSEFYANLKGWLKNSSKKCNLILWHTEIYHEQRFNMVSDFGKLPFSSGGTDIEQVIKHIDKSKPDLAIVLTDGYYDSVKTNMKEQIIWCISKNGTIAHPMKHIGKTLRLE